MKTIKEIDRNILVFEELLILISSSYDFDEVIQKKLNDFISFLDKYVYSDNIHNDIIDDRLFNVVTYEEN